MIVVKRDYVALDGVDIILSAAMPEDIVFRTTYLGRQIIRVWCMMEEDVMINELILEFSEIAIDEALMKLGCSMGHIRYVLNVLTQLSKT